MGSSVLASGSASEHHNPLQEHVSCDGRSFRMEPRDNLKAARDLASALRAAGWSEGAGSLPKSEALATAARIELQPPNLLTLRSEGHCLIYGSGQTALDVGVALAEKSNLTVCRRYCGRIPAGSLPELIRGEITDATGHCGAFRVTVRNMARLSPMSRQQFGVQGPTATTTIECDTILDVSGRASLFRGCEERDGYIRANPFDPLSLGKAMLQATDWSGNSKSRATSSSRLSCARIHAIAGLDAQTASTSALPALFRLMAIMSHRSRRLRRLRALLVRLSDRRDYIRQPSRSRPGPHCTRGG